MGTHVSLINIFVMSISELMSKNRKEVSDEVLNSLRAARTDHRMNIRVVRKLKSKAVYHIERVQRLLGMFQGEGMLYMNPCLKKKVCYISYIYEPLFQEEGM